MCHAVYLTGFYVVWNATCFSFFCLFSIIRVHGGNECVWCSDWGLPSTRQDLKVVQDIVLSLYTYCSCEYLPFPQRALQNERGSSDAPKGLQRCLLNSGFRWAQSASTPGPPLQPHGPSRGWSTSAMKGLLGCQKGPWQGPRHQSGVTNPCALHQRLL